MALATRSYSKESRSSSFYSRSTSFQTQHRQTTNFERPLSERLIERDLSWSSFEPLSFDRIRSRFDDDFLQWHYELGRPIPIVYRRYQRTIPVRYITAITHRARRPPRLYKKSDDYSSSSIKHDESLMKRENRISFDDWPARQEAPTRKRTSMTIFIQRPYVDTTEVPFYRQTLPTPTYPQSARFDYY